MKKTLFRRIPFAVFFCIVFIPGQSKAQVSGTVFQDFNGNATLDAGELGMPGVLIRAYSSLDVLLASATSAANGTYNLGAPTSNVAVRLEFIPPAGINCSPGYSSTVNGAGSATAVQFYAAAATRTVNFGVFDPKKYRAAATTNPTMVYTRFHLEDGAAGLATRDVIGGFGYTTSGAPGTTYYNSPLGTVGALWAVAYSRVSNRIFTAAVFKRHTRFGTGGAGGIYITDPVANTTALFTTIPNAGGNRHETNLLLDRINNAGTFNVAGANNPVTAAGTSSLGGMDLSEDNTTLYVTNLNDKLIYQVNATTGVVSGTTIAIPVTPGTLAEQASGIDRPWALKIYKGKMYVGVVRDASVSQNRADLRAFVFEYNFCTSSWNTTPLVTVNLNFQRGSIGNSNGQAFPNDQTRRWNPWINSWVGNNPAVAQDNLNNATNGGNGSGNYSEDKMVYAQPILSDIEFDDANAMILAFSDRLGFQAKREVLDQNGDDPGQASFGSAYTKQGAGNLDLFAGGDIMRVGQCTPGVWTVENNASVCGVTTAGAGQGQGLGGGEFYWGEHALGYGGATSGYHQESVQGALAVSPLTNQVMATALDPAFTGFAANVYTNGVITFNNTTGESVNAYEIVAYGDAFQKGNSMGDIEFMNDLAPIEIGNRVWNDANGDGIYEAGEVGIANVTISLYSGDLNNDGDLLDANENTLIAQTVTSASGDWYFNSGNVTDGDPATAGVQAGVQPNYSYIVRVGDGEGASPADWNDATGTGLNQLANFRLTTTDKIGNGQADYSDNDASLSANRPSIVFITGGYGYNNHNLDFGFKQLASIGDRVWRDDDLDGTQDAGEPGVAGITIELYQNGADNTAGTADDVKVGTTVTDAYGNYLFENLAASVGASTRYNLKYTLPANYAFTIANTPGDNANNTNSDANVTTGRTGEYILSAGEVELTADAGIIFSQPTTSSIGDKVWYDLNGDGNQDTNEPGMAGVTVTLYDNAGVVIATTVSDANGNYLFSNLGAGTYSVGFTLPIGFTFTAKDAGGNDNTDSDVNTNTALATFGKTDNFTLAGGENKTNIDAGLIAAANTTASVGDRVWNDLDQDGIQDADEPGVTGVTVTLYQGGSSIRTAVTDVFGNYSFTNLPAGSGYQVGITMPGGYTLSPLDQGTDNYIDSDIQTALGNRTALFNLSAGLRNPTLDAGIYQSAPAGTARVGDRVWFDQDADGVQDAAEAGLPGVVVTLYNSGATAIATTTTDANGNYYFTSLAAGTYSVGFSNLPMGYSLTSQDLGGDDALDSDANPATGTTATFVLAAGQNKTDLDAGVKGGQDAGTGSKGNKVWYDLNNDGLQGTSELGVAGVTVTLQKDLNNDGDFTDAGEATFASTNSNSLGEYIFTGLTSGSYRVQFSTLPAGYAASPQNAGTNDAVDSDGAAISAGASLTGTYSLTTGEDNLTIDLGLYSATRNSLGDKVWFDINSDGDQDADEPGIAGVMVRLYNDGPDNIAGNGDDVLLTVTSTDEAGSYLFSNLADDTYYVQFTNLPAGLILTNQDLGGNDALDSDADKTLGITTTYTLNAGTRTILTADAGLVSTRSSLGNFVWLDTDGDGVQDAGEAGVPGVTVSLYYDANNDGDFADAGENLPATSMITDQNGQYLFTNLTPGNYQVAFTTVPSGLSFTVQNTSGDNGNNTNSDADRTTGRSATISLTAGEADLTIDAGLFKPQAFIGNYVWVDRDSDGSQDANEPGLSGIVVTLVDVATGQPVSATVTNGSGGYVFTNVFPGTYYIQFGNLPSGGIFTTIDAGGNDNTDSDVNTGTGSTANFVVPATTVNLTFDAGVITDISTLPVRLEFNAVKKNNTAELWWDVSLESGVSKYVVERAADGRSFTAITNAQADGRATYKVTDIQPLQGVNYYRLRIENVDGSFEYSTIRIVVFNGKANLSVFPNPAKTVVNVVLPESWQQRRVTFELFNQAGQLVLRTNKQQASQVETLNLSALPAGMYNLRVAEANGETVSKKIYHQ